MRRCEQAFSNGKLWKLKVLGFEKKKALSISISRDLMPVLKSYGCYEFQGDAGGWFTVLWFCKDANFRKIILFIRTDHTCLTKPVHRAFK